MHFLVVVNAVTLDLLAFNSRSNNFTTVIVSIGYHSPYLLVLIAYVAIRVAKFIIRIIIYVAAFLSSHYVCAIGIWTHE